MNLRTGMSRKTSLTRRLIVPVLTGFVLILLLVGVILYREKSELVATEWNRKMDSVADAVVGIAEHQDKLSAIQRMMTHLAADREVEDLYLIDLQDQKIVAGSEHALLGMHLDDLPPEVLNERILKPCREASRRVHQTLTNDQLLSRYVPVELTYLESETLIPRRGCVVILLRPGNQAQKAMETMKNQGLAIAALLGLFLFVVLQAIRHRITEPLNQLARQVYTAGGEATIEADERLGSEIQGLVQAYNSTLSGIKSRQVAYKAQSQAFQAALRSAPLNEILCPLTDSVPKIFGDDARAAIIGVDVDGTRTNLISGMSDDFAASTNDMTVGPDSVDAGLAIHRFEPVIVPNAYGEPAWQPWLHLASRFGFKGCWSVPIRGTDGLPSASFSVYWRTDREPDDEAMQLLNFLTDTSALLIENHRQQRIRVEAQQKTVESEARFRVLFDESPDPYLVIEVHDSRILDCNPATEAALKCKRADIIGKTVVDISPTFQPDGKRSSEAIRKPISESGTLSFEWLHRRADGEIFPVMVNCVLSFLDGKKVILVGWRDMTVLKRAEAALRQFKSTLDATHDCVFMFHPDTLRFFYVNQGACEQLGYSEAELLGMHPYDIKPEFSEPKFRKLIAPVLDGSQQNLRFETVHRHKDGHDVPVEESLQLIAPAGEPPRIVSIVTDITVRRQLQETLRQERDQLELTVRQRTADLERAKDEAESSTRAKSEFLANMSHEVRSPLTAVLGYADMLMDPDLTPDVSSQAVQAIRRNGAHLLAILNDILDLSKIEAGRIDIEQVAYSPWQLVQEVDSLLKVRAEELQVSIRSIACGPLPPLVQIDPTRVRQVLLNLVGNAVKFSEPGDTVEILVSIEPKADPGRAELTIEVKDEGIGMTPEQLKLIFQPFRQADTTTTRKYGGTGLGLSITQRMVELMHGSIEVQSELGAGSSFKVRLPVTIPADNGNAAWLAPERKEPAAGETTGRKAPMARPVAKLKGRVLVAEDSEDIRKVIAFMLGRMGLKAEIAVNGQEAYLAALQEPYDLILMDMQMPVMDGYAATQALRKSGYRRKIVALTAHSMSEDRDKCLNVGCDDYLTKPLNEQLLTETVSRILNAAT